MERNIATHNNPAQGFSDLISNSTLRKASTTQVVTMAKIRHVQRLRGGWRSSSHRSKWSSSLSGGSGGKGGRSIRMFRSRGGARYGSRTIAATMVLLHWFVFSVIWGDQGVLKNLLSRRPQKLIGRLDVLSRPIRFLSGVNLERTRAACGAAPLMTLHTTISRKKLCYQGKVSPR